MNTPPNDGGQAFPHLQLCEPPEVANAITIPGLTKRELFAILALQGMLCANALAMDEVTDKNVDQVLAREACASADALIAELNKSQTQNLE